MNEFERNVWCLLGIPVDVVTFGQAIEMLDSAIKRNERCFFSTPNLNFIVAADKDETFSDSVLCSDLVLLDGMPPVWAARLLGIGGIEKISGSSLVERLWQRDSPGPGKMRVYLFGGEDGVATLQFLRRDGSIIQDMQISPVREHGFGFMRSDGAADIAGFVLTNADPQGLALDNLRFDPPLQMGARQITRPKRG